MAVNFPDPPLTTGQVYTVGSRSWTWNGKAWQATSATIGYTGSQSTIIGYTGSDGVGYTGSLGYTGSQGEIGYTGSLGYTGSIGDTGYTGSFGYTGSIGFTGSFGDTGYTGSMGPAINIVGSILVSYDLPQVDAVLGDGYIVTTTGHLWVYTNSSLGGNIYGFQDFGNMVGFTGSIGYTGSASTVRGYSGSIGYTGSASTEIGYTGSYGDQGYWGSFGYT